MSYDIRKSDGTQLVILDNEIIDTETITGIGLVGRLSANYGETQSNNFVHLVENFASKNFPENPLKGQLCYKLDNNGDGSLYICVNSATPIWKKMPIVLISNENPLGTNYETGDMWYDTKEHSFKMYDSNLGENGVWLTIGPSNFNNTISKIDINSNSSIYDTELSSFELPNEVAGYMFTCQVIGKEVPKNSSDIMESSALYGCIIKFMVNTYNTNNGYVYEIVKEPDYELIGSNINGWSVKAKIDDNKVKILVSGSISEENNTINWICNMNALKITQNDISE